MGSSSKEFGNICVYTTQVPRNISKILGSSFFTQEIGYAYSNSSGRQAARRSRIVSANVV